MKPVKYKSEYLIVKSTCNRPISQMRMLQAACRKLEVGYNRFPKVLYIFEHKT